MTNEVQQSDAIEWLRSLPPKSVDLVFFSPPYEDCRTYGLPPMPVGQAWVDWMVEVFAAATAACRGLVACVCEGKTRKFKYTATPFLLVADLHRKGFNLRKPPIFHRVGIPGSGGPDWLRNDYETIICVTPPGRGYFDVSAVGKPPKYAPGGRMSYRGPAGYRQGDTGPQREYTPPPFANPGNVITCKVGGGHLGDPLAHENEAPFPEALVEFFVAGYTRPDGIVADPFAGSGTTLAVAKKLGRQYVGCDIRESQILLTRERLARIEESTL